ncbi:MAG TPA: hypothetical protein VF661_15310 [Actinomycetales bacterium]|jgi:hypothetical protein
MSSDEAVAVEVLLMGVTPHGISYRPVRADLAGSGPDDLARELAGDVALVHSTSWRFEDGVVVLTYAALPDPRPQQAAHALVDPSVVCSGDPMQPAPPVLHLPHVAAHAVRHLAYLAEHDPGIAPAQHDVALARLWGMILDMAHRIPTSTHERAHRLAAAVSEPVPQPAVAS